MWSTPAPPRLNREFGTFTLEFSVPAILAPAGKGTQLDRRSTRQLVRSEAERRRYQRLGASTTVAWVPGSLRPLHAVQQAVQLSWRPEAAGLMLLEMFGQLPTGDLRPPRT